MTDKQNPIACEPCRQKKCKCDRTLPVCSQCSDPTRCSYPQSGKRGLPQGYVTALENRLAATERALYSTYARLRTMSPNSFTINPDSPGSTLTRTTSLSEWTMFPLRDCDDVERWWAEKSRLYGSIDASGDNPRALVGTNLKESQEALTSTSRHRYSNNHGDNQKRVAQSGGNLRGSRSARLAERESEVYF